MEVKISVLLLATQVVHISEDDGLVQQTNELPESVAQGKGPGGDLLLSQSGLQSSISWPQHRAFSLGVLSIDVPQSM